jgi:hypothetical protein
VLPAAAPLLALEAAACELELGGESAGGAVAVALGAGPVEGAAGASEGLLAGDHDGRHAAALLEGSIRVEAGSP